MNPRVGLYIVAACAAVLSFAGLYSLAIACGFATWLAVLVPVLVEAGVASSSLVWLGGHHSDRSRRFARRQTLALLAVSVLGNALSHALAAYQARPHWGVVVTVASLAPATFCSTLHLLSLVNQPGASPEEDLEPQPDNQAEPVLDIQPEPHLDIQPEAAEEMEEPVASAPLETTLDIQVEKARELVLAGKGRGTLQKELGLTEYKAKEIIRDVKGATNGKVVA